MKYSSAIIKNEQVASTTKTHSNKGEAVVEGINPDLEKLVVGKYAVLGDGTVIENTPNISDK